MAPADHRFAVPSAFRLPHNGRKRGGHDGHGREVTVVPHAGDSIVGGGRIAARLAVVGLLAAVTAALLYAGTVGTPTGQLIGELILGGRPASVDVVSNAERVLSVLSRSSLVVGTLTVCAIAILGRRPRLAAAAAATVVAANVTTQVLKLLVLDRIDLLDGLFYPLPNSFPSGHATAGVARRPPGPGGARPAPSPRRINRGSVGYRQPDEDR